MSLDDDIRNNLVVDTTSPTGLRWKQRVNNRCHPELIAFTTLRKGYYAGRFRGKDLEAHRVVFFLTHGYWPRIVDHWDRNKQNNDPTNLLDTDAQGNAQNTIGRGWTRRGNSYAAQITVDGVPQWLGSYPTAEEAHTVYLAAKQEQHRVNMQHKTHIH